MDIMKKEQIKKVIKNWVAEKYGNLEEINPSWDIDSLAQELEQHTS